MAEEIKDRKKKNDRQANEFDVWRHFWEESRIVTLYGQVTPAYMVISVKGVASVAEDIMGKLMYLADKNREPIKLLINNIGGNVGAGFTIIQAMEHVKAKGIELWTVNIGMAASMAGIILMMGTKNRRFVMKDSVTHLHSGDQQVSGAPEDVQEIVNFMNKNFIVKVRSLIQTNSDVPYFWNEKAEKEYSAEQLKNQKVIDALIQDFLGGERYLTDEDAVKAGIADRVLASGDPLLDQIFKPRDGKGGE